MDVEVWAGDLSAPPSSWIVVFDGQLEAGVHGLTIGTAYYAVFRLDLPPGLCTVRAEGRRDAAGDIEAVRLILLDHPEANGTVLFTPPNE